MTLNFRLFVIVLLVVPINIYSQVYESIEKTAAQYFISLSMEDSKADDDLIGLKEVLSKNYDKAELKGKYQTTLEDFESLKNHFSEFESTIKNISQDSALVLFNQWYLHFSNAFYNYADEKFFSSDKTKILFFSISMSCHCTLEMCRQQTLEVLNLAREKNLDYWIIDSYEHNELQLKYETLFAPSLIMSDRNNNVLLKIEYDKNMIAKLNQFVKSKLKG
jgi:hypothetical protein